MRTAPKPRLALEPSVVSVANELSAFGGDPLTLSSRRRVVIGDETPGSDGVDDGAPTANHWSMGRPCRMVFKSISTSPEASASPPVAPRESMPGRPNTVPALCAHARRTKAGVAGAGAAV
jgi:hypothetical protein